MERVAKLFKNDRNQAVRLPVEFEFDTVVCISAAIGRET